MLVEECRSTWRKIVLMPLYPPHIPQELSLGLNQELCSGNLATNRLSSIMEIFKLPTPKMEASKDLNSPKLPLVGGV